MRLVEGVHYTKVTYKDIHNDENFASHFYGAKKQVVEGIIR